MSNKIKDGGMHAKRVTGDIITYIFLMRAERHLADPVLLAGDAVLP